MSPEWATEASFQNEGRIQPETKCGCYHCLSVYLGSAINKWIAEGGFKLARTAICPSCGIDSVIPYNEPSFWGLARLKLRLFTPIF